MQVTFKSYQSLTRSWDDLRQDAAQFASGVGRENLINITVTAQGGIGILTVWYWGDGPSPQSEKSAVSV